jgi:Transposase IS116/IS110/IS902 family
MPACPLGIRTTLWCAYMLVAKSSESLIARSTFFPGPSASRARCALSGKLNDADGRRRSGRDPSRPMAHPHLPHQRAGSTAAGRTSSRRRRGWPDVPAHLITPLGLPRDSSSAASSLSHKPEIRPLLSETRPMFQACDLRVCKLFLTAAHLASWAGICPGNHESAGRRKSGRTRRAFLGGAVACPRDPRNTVVIARQATG